MKKLKIIYCTIILVCVAIWFSTGEFDGITRGYFTFRSQAIQLTGLLAFFAMTVDMVIACRLKWVDDILGGLDKAYRLHKWFGITALVTAILHFLLAKGTKWAVGWGWLERPVRHSGLADLPEKVSLEYVFSIFRKNAELFGEWAFYIAVALCVIALVKLIPYRFFAHVHTIFAGVYLVLVFHAVVLTKFPYWGEPFGLLMLVAAIFGTVSAITILLRKFGFGRHVNGTIIEQIVDKTNKVVRLTLKVSEKWRGHQSGQFAFITVDSKEGAHPFTIASAWDQNSRLLTFFIKGLGDYTNKLLLRDLVHKKVRIDGPYGRFFLVDHKEEQQIWIGAGIGITPFLAKLDELARQQQGQRPDVDFVYVCQSLSSEDDTKLHALAKSAGVRLTIWLTPERGRFDGTHLRKMFVNWKQSSIWFCGPKQFGETLEDDMAKNGLPHARFYRELFEMR